MDHTAFSASLSAEEKNALYQRSDSKGLRHLELHLAALLAKGIYIALQAPLWGLVLVPYGIAMMFLFTLSHECTHATPFARPKVNDLVGHAVSLPLLLPFTWFRYFHLAHHKWTNDPEHDPELAGGGRPVTWQSYLIYLSGWGYWRANAAQIWSNAFGTINAPYLPARKHPAMRREARILIGIYTMIALSLVFTPLALWLWIVPALIGQPLLRLYLLAEHGHCPPVANMLENTRTIRTNRLICFIAWNMPYHAEHHAMPMVPFHALPRLHRRMEPHLKSVSDGYGSFTKDYVRGLE